MCGMAGKDILVAVDRIIIDATESRWYRTANRSTSPCDALGLSPASSPIYEIFLLEDDPFSLDLYLGLFRSWFRYSGP